MVFKKLFSSEKAVSPVIGVMLMIVVTVILAAAVSSFASSTQTQDAAPQATLKASASYNDGYITLEDLGGDILTKANMNIEIAYGNPTTSGYVNMTNVTFSPESDYLRPGDSATIPFTQYESEYITGAGFYDGDIHLTVAIGTPFKVSVIDKETGQTVYTSAVTLNP
ncbi:type IV pilin N-terminal domain-containing protein [uncultured Methanomethylovorans sp.]|uniref:type IV pilin N-terminal domain-containing protein n=1 Tax=uncultured Methanomethylovorans sp. TaxID=183759 RepID=UPI002AA70D45|nr:type IV pilin N-terminal domain-containing protein [uncultured Methanomethylovorans sp.]